MARREFQLEDFMPYLLNRAAEATSREFQAYYKGRYGMLRTEWRVLFHLGRFGPLTASAICRRADLHKTKVSRAVAALERRRFISRTPLEGDRRHEMLHLTRAGSAAFRDLVAEAERFNRRLLEPLGGEEAATLRRILLQFAGREG